MWVEAAHSLVEDGQGVSGGKGQAGNQQPTQVCLHRLRWAETASSLAWRWGERNYTQFLNWKGEEKAKAVNC